MAKLRHLALLTDQPEKLADFYKKVFELQETHRSPTGAIQLSDGEFNLTIQHTKNLKPSQNPPQVGLYHFGFHIDDLETSLQRIGEAYPDGPTPMRMSGTGDADARGSDPDGNSFDLSTRGWSPKRPEKLG
jgi:catechol-2,3-dioxygenase